jgi:site-specific recombinase XerD
MASIWKHPASPYWTACYTNHLGRQVKKSTKQTSKRAAERIAQEWEDAERLAKQKQLTTVQLQKFASDLAQKITGDSIHVPIVEKFFTDWISTKRSKRKAEGTIERYEGVIRAFKKSLGEMQRAQISAIAPKHVQHFLNTRLEAGAAPKTVITDVKILRAAFNYAERFGYILKNPAAPIELPDADSHQREIFSAEEVVKLYQTAWDEGWYEWATMIVLGYYTGARLTDCAQMRWENVNFDQSFLTYTQSKTGKTLTLPLHVDLQEHLLIFANPANMVVSIEGCKGTSMSVSSDYYSPRKGFICPKMASRTTGGKHGLSESFKRLMKKADLDCMTVDGKGTRKFSKRSFHSLRYTFNSTLANAGVSQEIRVKLVGHSSFAMNDRYTKLSIAALEGAIKHVPAVSFE